MSSRNGLPMKSLVITCALIVGLSVLSSVGGNPLSTSASANVLASSTLVRVGDRYRNGFVIDPITTRRTAAGKAKGVLIPLAYKKKLRIRFPVNAHQGPQTWYVMHVDAIAYLSPKTRKQTAFISAATNERAAAQIQIDTNSDKNGPFAEATSVGLIKGFTRTLTRSRGLHIRFSNYLQKSGVISGDSYLEFAISEPDPNSGVLAVRILPDTRIVATSTPPPHLDLHIAFKRNADVTVGHVLNLKWSIRNRSTLSARAVSIGIDYVRKDFALLSRRAYSFATVTNTERGVFRLIPKRSVDTTITITVGSSNTNHPEIGLRAIVMPKRTGDSSITWLLRAMGLVLLTSPLWIWAARVARRRLHERS
jgi:hypothetical protein